MIVPVVIFFGGYLSTQVDVDSWVRSAYEQTKGSHIFEAYPYPELASSEDTSAVKHAAKTIEKVVDEVSRYESIPYTLVGHSSGCAIANEIADRLHEKGLKNWNLVCLDGYAPNKTLLQQSNLQLWSAYCGNEHSQTWDFFKKEEQFKDWEAIKAYSKWALHFSLVNLNANDDTVKKITDGYKNVKANLMFLEDEDGE